MPGRRVISVSRLIIGGCLKDAREGGAPLKHAVSVVPVLELRALQQLVACRVLPRNLVERPRQNLVLDAPRYDDEAVDVAEDEVARLDTHARAFNGHVDVD